jgi:hypothetical protein
MGARELAASLDHAAEDLRDLRIPSAKAGQLLLEKAHIPVVTGRLKSTAHVDAGPAGFALVVGGTAAPYAVPVHKRNPFLTRVIDSNVDDVERIYHDELEHIIDGVHA